MTDQTSPDAILDEDTLEDEELDAAPDGWSGRTITWALHLDTPAFDDLVSEVMDSLPTEWTPLLDTIAVVVEEEPELLDDDDLDEYEDDEEEEGEATHKERYGDVRGTLNPLQLIGGGLAGPAVAAPPEIVLFQGPLERASESIDDLRALVRSTLIEEIGRCLGVQPPPSVSAE